ncbi:unnamed protein product [Effrenium voratum]|nr:unnamed protein product [Effrenium voratum]|mmetsp:Transcript_77465/g.185709  ORF Transcript_77465/g.185709 Transcript_77465/m.185709 type:complete len:806 (-) Transcript_77465:233-2650(-)
MDPGSPSLMSDNSIEQPRQRMEKEITEAVNDCVEKMKAELMPRLSRIIQNADRSRRRASFHQGFGGPLITGLPERQSQGESLSLSGCLVDLPDVPSEPQKHGPRGGVPVFSFGGRCGPRTSPRLQLLPAAKISVDAENPGVPREQSDDLNSPELSNGTPEMKAERTEGLRLHKAWKIDTVEPQKFMKHGSSATMTSDTPGFRRSRSNGGKEDNGHYAWYDRFTMSHRSPFCMCWDIWTSIAIGYDMVMTPMDAFRIELTPVLKALERTSSGTWLADMLLSFVRSFGKLNGTEERHLRCTAEHYLKSWFTFDFTLVCLDMFIFVMEDTAWMRYVGFLRAVRLFRLLRVLRIAKVKARIAVLAQLLHILQTQRITDRGFLILNIVKSLMVITVINHFTACCWYAIATLMEDDNNWVNVHFKDQQRPDDLLYLYTTAYHWSITQLTPASMEIYPYSSRERIFNIAVILFGLCVFSSFISSMAQQLHALQQLSREHRHRMSILRRFISEHHMSVALATTIVEFVRQKRGPQLQRPLKIDDIDMFSNFPTVLIHKIRSETYHSAIGKHSLYQYIYEEERDIFGKICNTCICEKIVDKGHEVFAAGDEGYGMYFICHGKLGYIYGMDDDVFDPTDSQEWMRMADGADAGHRQCCFLMTGRVVCEVAMWLLWNHRGRLFGDSVVTDLLFVQVEPFREVITNSSMLKDIRLYARLYALRALRTGKEGQILDDVWHEDETIEEISRLALHGGLEAAVTTLAANRATPARILKAWRQQAQAGRLRRTLYRPARQRLCEWLRCCFNSDPGESRELD